MRYRAIQEHDRRDPIRLMCRTLTVSPAGREGGPRNLDSVISGSFASPTPSDGGDTEE